MCVRPSTTSYGSFSLDMGRSPGFGSAAADLFALFRLGFPSAPELYSLTSPAPATRRTVLQKVRGCALALPQLVDTGFPVSHGTLDPARLLKISPTGLSPSLAGFPKTVRLSLKVPSAVRNPGTHARRFGLLPFRSPLLWKSMFLSLPPGT